MTTEAPLLVALEMIAQLMKDQELIGTFRSKVDPENVGVIYCFKTPDVEILCRLMVLENG